MLKRSDQKEKPHGPIGILGGGLCGVYLASRFKELGVPFELFEADDSLGGLARTFNTEGFKWDLGVHAIYSKNPELMDIFQNLPLDYQRSSRNVKICHVQGDRVYELDYPFENGLDGLPHNDWLDCIVGYMVARQQSGLSYSNILEWIQSGLGYGIERCFMRPYNEKIWNASLGKISMDLVANKIEPEPFETVLNNALGNKSIGRSYQARFIYPKHGIQEVIDYFASKTQDCIFLHKNINGIRIESGKHILSFTDGSESRPFGSLVSTIPLKKLISYLPYPDLYPLAAKLKHNDTLFTVIGLKSGQKFERFHTCHWTFFAGDEIFYRLTMMHNFTDAFPVTAVAEHTIRDGRTLDVDRLERIVIKDLLKREILRSECDIGLVDHHIAPFTYPIPTVDTKQIKVTVKRFLEDKRIHLLGRNGNWDYINMDQVISRVNGFIENLDMNYASHPTQQCSSFFQ